MATLCIFDRQININSVCIVFGKVCNQLTLSRSRSHRLNSFNTQFTIHHHHHHLLLRHQVVAHFNGRSTSAAAQHFSAFFSHTFLFFFDDAVGAGAVLHSLIIIFDDGKQHIRGISTRIENQNQSQPQLKGSTYFPKVYC